MSILEIYLVLPSSAALTYNSQVSRKNKSARFQQMQMDWSGKIRRHFIKLNFVPIIKTDPSSLYTKFRI